MVPIDLQSVLKKEKYEEQRSLEAVLCDLGRDAGDIHV